MGDINKEPLLSGQNSAIFSDIHYSSPDKRYSFVFTHLEKGIFLLTSVGYANETSIKIQIQTGDTIIDWIAIHYPEECYHLIWDISEFQGASILARYVMMLRATAKRFGSINIIGVNNIAKSFAKVVSNLIPSLEIHFYKTVDEAVNRVTFRVNSKMPEKENSNCFITPETDSYARFMNLWQHYPEYKEINNRRFKVLQLDRWKYVSTENNYSATYSIIEGNIVLLRCEGSIKISNIEKTYQILDDIISRFGFDNAENKFYSIVDLKKVRGITLNARKLTHYYEELYKDKAYMVIMLPSPILHFVLKLQQRINSDYFSHWTEKNNLVEAFDIVLQHQNGNHQKTGSVNKNNNISLTIPESKEELITLVKTLQAENQQIKKSQKEHIQRILEITGRMTWDESFSYNFEFIPEKQSPFTDVYNAISVVHSDFKEILKEKQIDAQKLKESEEKYWNLINLASDIIVVFQNRSIKLISSRVTDILGYTPEETKSSPLETFIHHDELRKITNNVERIAENAPLYFETHLIHKTGKLIPVSVSVGNITYENNPARIYIIRDNTSRKIAEAELDKYRNQLELMVAERTKQLEKEIIEREAAEKSDRLKSAFLSNMSHEIRTPMNAIIAFSNFLRNPGITKEQRDEYVNYIQSSGQSLLNLINDIIDISKIEAKQISIEKINCQINPILEELYTLFEETRKNKGNEGADIRFVKNFKINNLIVYTDPYRLKQILSNLLHNALKFTEKGIIEFGYEIKNNMVEFYVKDSGIGIPKEKVDFIFQRFGKLEANGRNRGGTGLGLAISQNLATMLDGNIRVESVPCVGSTFYLSIPYGGEQHINFDMLTPDYTEKEFYKWDNKKILIAEDEDLNYKVIEIALRDTNAQIIRAFNGKEAVEAVKNDNDINLVLMDIQMPEMDGYDAFAKIRQNRYIPVIAQTAFALIEEKEKCLRSGFSDYISKPIKIPELMRKIDKFIS